LVGESGRPQKPDERKKDDEAPHLTSTAILAEAPDPSFVCLELLVDTRAKTAYYIRNGYSMPSPKDLSPLTPPVFHILLALADEERHGYGIMQDVARQTNDALQLGPGTLYGCLKRMLAAGLVEESDERPDPELDDQRRRYYRMTALGRSSVRAEAGRLAAAVAAAKAKLGLAGGK
jgi:DNA-binding MarR family transcriptional regulator